MTKNFNTNVINSSKSIISSQSIKYIFKKLYKKLEEKRILQSWRASSWVDHQQREESVLHQPLRSSWDGVACGNGGGASQLVQQGLVQVGTVCKSC